MQGVIGKLSSTGTMYTLTHIEHNLEKMLADRGYTILARDYKEGFVVCDQAFVFLTSQKLTTASFGDMVRALHGSRRRHVILVHEQPVNANIRNIIARMHLLLRVEAIPRTFFSICLPEHVLVPPHRTATPGELGSLDAKKLPCLRQADPVAMYYDFKAGTIVRIDRPCGPAFRLVK